MGPHECLPLVLHGLLWDPPNRQLTHRGGVLTLLRFLGIIPLLNNLKCYLKEKWVILWCQTRRSLSSRSKSSLGDHRFSMSSLIIFDPTSSFSTSSKLVRSWDGL